MSTSELLERIVSGYRHRIFDKKLANNHSIQIPGLIRAAIERKRVGLVGNGDAIWDHVHVVDRKLPSYSLFRTHAN